MVRKQVTRFPVLAAKSDNKVTDELYILRVYVLGIRVYKCTRIYSETELTSNKSTSKYFGTR